MRRPSSIFRYCARRHLGLDGLLSVMCGLATPADWISSDWRLRGLHGLMQPVREDRAGQAEVLRFFLRQNNMDPNRHRDIRLAPLHLCAFNDRPDLMKELVGHKAIQPDARDERGNTALIIAAAHGYMECIGILAGAGADLEATEKGGHTALMVAALRGRKEAVEKLVSLGARCDAVNDAGQTAGSLARAHGFVGIADILEEVQTRQSGISVAATSSTAPGARPASSKVP